MMFNQDKNTKTSSEGSKEQNKIGQGTKIVGDLKAKGGFRIDGNVEGNVETPGKVVIGKEGFINGHLECENADIEGKFVGKLHIKNTLTLRSTALVEGEAVVAKLAVEPGATFNATCSMTGGLKSIHHETGGQGKKQQEKEKSA